jgi:hypothetical protein
LTDLESLEATARSHLARQREKNKKLITATDKLNASLAHARKRESDLTITLANTSLSSQSNKLSNSHPVIPGNEKEAGETSELMVHHSHDDFLRLHEVVIASELRCKEMQVELDDARSSLNDLLIEIDSVATEGIEAREQSAKLLNQLNDSHRMQSGLLEENMQLQRQLADVNTKLVESQKR